MKKEFYLEIKAKVDAYEKVKAEQDEAKELLDNVQNYKDGTDIESSDVLSMSIHLPYHSVRVIPEKYAQRLYSVYINMLIDDIQSLEKVMENL